MKSFILMLFFIVFGFGFCYLVISHIIVNGRQIDQNTIDHGFITAINSCNVNNLNILMCSVITSKNNVEQKVYSRVGGQSTSISVDYSIKTQNVKYDDGYKVYSVVNGIRTAIAECRFIDKDCDLEYSKFFGAK